jgi:hypothetical protein
MWENKVIENGIEYTVKESTHGDKYWYLNDGLHRINDLPAVEYITGNKEWFVDGKRHRDNNPAIITSNGTKHWFIEGEEYTEKEFLYYTRKKKIALIIE